MTTTETADRTAESPMSEYPDINYDHEVVSLIARALADGDHLLLEHVEAETEGWLEADEMKDAREALIAAVSEAIDYCD